MGSWRWSCLIGFLISLASGAVAAAQESPSPAGGGSIRGVVTDRDFDAPLGGVQVVAIETGQKAVTSEQGNYVFAQMPPGRYTLVFSKEGYLRQVKGDVAVTAGQLTDLDVALEGEFTEMDEFVVQDLQIGAGSEAALLALRFESPALMDSVSSDLMSRAGASDAASALKLVSGASVQGGKYAVIRGLPDRYVSSQLNSLVLPTADENKRAVQLDQFPAPVIESIQVAKTFTPDQQGEASGGAVNLELKSIPDDTVLQFSGQVGVNSQETGSDNFLSYDGGGVHTGGGSIQPVGTSWKGAVGTQPEDAPLNYKWSAAAGGKHELGDGTKIGGLLSVFYERDSTFFDDGKNDSWWVTTPGGPMVPQTNQGTPQQGDFKTALYDVTQGSQWEKWGGLATIGVETENNSVGLTYLYTYQATDTATLATDTRGKAYFFPGYNPNDPMGTGNEPGNLNAAPYLRTETLDYTEETTGTLQLSGRHRLPVEGFGLGPLQFGAPEVDWTIAESSATLDEPDKTQFGALWLPASFNPGFPPFVPPFTTPPTWFPYKPGANFNLGNMQHIFKSIDEDSSQYALNLKLPFKQWTDDAGYLKFGSFADQVDRTFKQDTFSNFGDSAASFQGGWNDPWSTVFPNEDHPITASNADVDYDGHQKIRATYGMLNLPLSSSLNLIGGERYESTDLGVVNHPEADAFWFPPGATAPVHLNPGDADVNFKQDDMLPALALEFRPTEQLTLRGSYSETVARQTFKELTPIIQQEYLGGPIFIGNPDLKMSSLQNYDLRADYVPYQGALVSASRFTKDIKDPIEYVQKVSDFTYTTPENFPRGELSGYETEVRQNLGEFWESLQGLSVGANATFIQSRVTLSAEEAAQFTQAGIQAPEPTRDMTGAPDRLYNLYLTYDLPDTGTQYALFYTVTGDTLVAGAGVSNGNFVPDVYAKQYGTLNLSMSQKLSEKTTLQIQARNLTDPRIEEVYKSDFINGEVTRTSYTKGRTLTIGVTVRF